MNVLAINGSQRKGGRVSQLVCRAIDGARDRGHSVEFIHLSDIKLKCCTGCYSCQKGDAKGCVIRDDDIGVVEGKIAWADVLILGSPTHWGNIASPMLVMFERLFGFLIRERPNRFPLKMRARGKRVILISACSTDFPFNWIFNQTRAVFSRFHEICRYSGMRIIGRIALPGTITMSDVPKRYLDKAYRAGAKA